MVISHGIRALQPELDVGGRVGIRLEGRTLEFPILGIARELAPHPLIYVPRPAVLAAAGLSGETTRSAYLVLREHGGAAEKAGARDVERDGRSLRIVPLDLVALVHEVAERYRDRPPEVRVVAAPSTLQVEADAGGVRTVLRNVLENALEFSLPDSRPIEIAVISGPQAAVVRVTDDGAGIPAGALERLFEPFFRPDPSRSRKTGGSGLGLSICKRIMEAHRGTIELTRHEGRGVTVTLEFPSIAALQQ